MNKLTADRLNELKTLVGEWADKNFKVHAPAIGILEEIGEAAHCILKRKQGIRGFDNEQYFKEQLKDAIADIAIYCFHAAHITNLDFMDFVHDMNEGEGNDEYLLANLAENACGVLQEDNYCIGEVLDYAQFLAMNHGINFADAVEETWAKVSQRDWKKNPTDAHAQPIELNGDESLNFFAALASELREIPPALKEAIEDIASPEAQERWDKVRSGGLIIGIDPAQPGADRS